jgi:plasmid replication initiation protein
MQVIIAFDVMEDGIKREVLTHLLGDCKLDHNPHCLAHYSFSDAMRQMLVSSSVFARLRRDLLYQFRSKYALTLYEMLQKRINLSHKTSDDFTIDEIRQKLGVEKNKYPAYRSLNQAVLKPAEIEVNGLSDIACSLEPINEGRAVVGVKLFWRKKENNEAAKSVEDLQKNNSGRKVRIGGQVVQIYPNQTQVNEAEEPKRIGNRLRELDTRECEQLKKTFFGYDIYSLYNEFQIWIDKTQGEIPDSPPAAFTNWLKNYYKITGPRRT